MSKELPNLKFKLEDNGKIIVKNAILSYPNIFEPYKGDNAGAKPKYSARFRLAKETHLEELKALMAHIHKLCVKELKTKIPADRLCLQNGANTGKDEDVGNFILSASESRRPVVYDADGKTTLSIEDAEDKIYAGATVNVVIALWIQNNKYGKRCNANLLAIQFVKATPRIGREIPDTSDDFESVSDSFDDDFGDDIDTSVDGGLDGADSGFGDDDDLGL